MTARLSVALLSREYPPAVYGGAGVHVEWLARALARHVDVRVHCFGAARGAPEVARSYEPWSALDGAAPYVAALRTMSVDLAMAAGVEGADVVHTHTWYANLAGHLAKLVHGVPHVMTSHSLEPLRPWKAEQLGGGYALSSFCERTAIESADAIIAVSSGMKSDILRAYPRVDADRVTVIHNGIDPVAYRKDPATDRLGPLGIDPSKPYFAFVGRVTRQKGIVHLLDAALETKSGASIVACAGEADTREIAREVRERVEALRASRGGITWIERMLDRADVVQILSHASAFVCPSVYEPFGIVNVEAMACGAPVVASAVGGIPEIVVHEETGILVPFEPDGTALGTPRDPRRFATDLAAAMDRLVADPALARRLGDAGRARVLERFTWESAAERTASLYRSLVA